MANPTYDFGHDPNGRPTISQGGRVVGQPIGVAYGTPQANYQRFLDAGTPLVFGEKHTLGTSRWSPGSAGTASAVSGPDAMLPWQGGTPGTGTSGGMGRIHTSIVPRPIYSPEHTLTGTNLAVANLHAGGNLPSLLKQFDSPGISRGAAHMARAMPLMARARQGAARARAQVPLEDAFANAQAMLGGETARENEALQWANIGLKMRGNEQDYLQGLARQRLGQAGGVMSMVDNLFG